MADDLAAVVYRYLAFARATPAALELAIALGRGWQSSEAVIQVVEPLASRATPNPPE